MTTVATDSGENDILALLSWYREAGVDEATGDLPLDRFRLSAERRPAAAADMPPSPAAPKKDTDARPGDRPTRHTAPAIATAQKTAQQKAMACNTLAELKQAVLDYDACGLKSSAMSTLFADGPDTAPVMVIGGTPDADADRSGKPYAGDAGRLLDRMLGAISLSRKDTARLTYLVPWRPPGNRQPSAEELAHCLPFLRRHIALVGPALIVCLGVTATNALIGGDLPITKARGHFIDMTLDGLTIPLTTLYRPGDLLNQPRLKAYAWKDCLALMDRLADISKG